MEVRLRPVALATSSMETLSGPNWRYRRRVACMISACSSCGESGDIPQSYPIFDKITNFVKTSRRLSRVAVAPILLGIRRARVIKAIPILDNMPTGRPLIIIVDITAEGTKDIDIQPELSRRPENITDLYAIA